MTYMSVHNLLGDKEMSLSEEIRNEETDSLSRYWAKLRVAAAAAFCSASSSILCVLMCCFMLNLWINLLHIHGFGLFQA